MSDETASPPEDEQVISDESAYEDDQSEDRADPSPDGFNELDQPDHDLLNADADETARESLQSSLLRRS